MIIAVSSMVVAFLLMRSSEPEQTITHSAADQKNNTMVESPVIIERKDGNILWQLRAEDAEQQLNGSMHLRMPTLVLYTESQKEITITSQQAWFNPLTRNLRFQAKVLVHYEIWSLSTETLIYNSSKDELSTPDAFQLWGGSIKAKGKNMHMQRQNEKISVDDGIQINDSTPLWRGVSTP